MNTRLLKMISLVIAVALMLGGCSLIEVNKEADDQTVVAEFTGGKILKGDAMARYAEVEAYYESYGHTLTDADTIQSIKQDILTMMCEEEIVHKKAEEMGLTTLTDEERQALTDETTEQFESAIEYYAIYFDEGDEEANRQAAIDFLAEQGYTLESEVEYAIENAWQQRMQDEITKDVTASDENIQIAYEEMVDADRETFAESPYDFEYAVTSGETVAWIPEGYRTVKHILIPFTEEQVMALDDLLLELEDVRYQMEDEQVEEGDIPAGYHVHEDGTLHADDDGHGSEGELLLEADGEATEAPIVADPEPEDLPDEDFGGDTDETPLTDEELIAKEAELSQKYEALKAEYAATLQAKVDEVLSKIAAGEDFNHLIEEYGDDYGMTVEPGKTEGYYVCENSEMWEEEFTKAAMALANPGDVSGPVIGSMGIHIIRYEKAIAGGAVPLETLRASVEETALGEAKDAFYQEQVDVWMGESNVRTYVDRMK